MSENSTDFLTNSVLYVTDKIEGARFKKEVNNSSRGKFEEVQKLMQSASINPQDSIEVKKEKLLMLGLEKSRSLHEQSIHYYFEDSVGSIGIRTRKDLAGGGFVDAFDTQYSIDTNKGDELLTLDFLPYAQPEKNEENVLETLFLGAIDLERFIELYKHKDGVPEVITGRTNLTLARFSIKHLGFHAQRGFDVRDRFQKTSDKAKRRRDRNKVIPEKVLRDEELGSILTDNEQISGYEVRVFVKRDDLIHNSKLEGELSRVKEVLASRMLRKKSVTQEDIDALEHRCRIDAAMHNLKLV